MNFKNVAKKKKKNVAVIVIASILSVVLAGGALAGVGYGLGWWGKAEEAPAKLEVPTSTYNLEIASLDELICVEFTPEDYSSYISTYSMTNQEMVDMGLIDDVTQEPTQHYEYCSQVLNIDGIEYGAGYGVDFELPEEGQYEITVKINGTEYTTDYTGIAPSAEGESDGANIVFAAMYFLDAEGKQVEVAMGEDPGDEVAEVVQIMILDKFMRDIDHAFDGVEGYTMFIMHMDRGENGSAINTFEIVSIERIGELQDFDVM